MFFTEICQRNQLSQDKVDRCEFVVYSDESGNTGPDLLSTDQPSFVYSFVHIPKEYDESILSEIIESSERIWGSPIHELHSITLLKSPRGLSVVENVGTLLNAAKISIQISFLEKRHQICEFIVESFLDAAHNPNAPDLLDRETKMYLQNAIYDYISDDVIRDFFLGVRNDDIDRIRASGEIIGNRLRFLPDERSSYYGAVIIDGLGNIYQYGTPMEDAPPRYHRPSAQVNAFAPGIKIINDYLHILGSHGILVCDEDLQFGESMDFTLKTTRDPNKFLSYLLGSMGKEPSISRILERTECSSAESAGIQVADVAAGITRSYFDTVANGITVRKNFQQSWEPFSECVLRAGRNHHVLVGKKYDHHFDFIEQGR